MDHTSVLLDESIEALQIKTDGIYVDATLGAAGHSSEILKRIPEGHLYSFEQDHTVVEVARKRLSAIAGNFTIVERNFVELKTALAELGVDKIDGILFDLGVSSMQFDRGERGFSYNHNARLDMRMNDHQELDAYQIINTWSFQDLYRILTVYGEEKFAKQIARSIERERNEQPIETTFQLVDLIKQTLPAAVLRKKGHPAKQTFQALRIAVNDELRVFETALVDAIEITAIHGRIAVISFHSLEDRIAKNIFKQYSSNEQKLPKNLPILPQDEELTKLKLINRKPIIAGEQELTDNNRAHSAKLRVAEVQR
ncbi:16S rRNA (cytosine(1402)-N(4))-methyltransferase RsmH [Culicoidibacter larvae]|uniref:Ribosomal RNA small subunit methyltransferase H n=1 Tax=Culicoidibacter larvae TaxID=2579976 RepID=A0A5R8QB79_9FIRM|nr:16S rRNA (cytosine(1402)-N(4))-methyltransferase RsmH [Culicoidibacter larvae]TLG72150.1 16S rRNA (cytosine(1402)-N(4))-methyltransferase RsmH [Culicoidibacter larvae]